MTLNPTPSLINRTLFNLRSAWQQVRIFKSNQPLLDPNLPDQDIEILREQIHDCLETRGGDVSARARAAELGAVYLHLNNTGKLRFLKLLANDFGVNNAEVRKFAQQIIDQPSDESDLKLQNRLRKALNANHIELFTQFNSLPSGIKFLVDLRADLRRFNDDDIHLRELDFNLKRLLRSWFDIGFLDLVRLSWSSPAAVLEKLITYEAVHAIRSWSDLKNRLESDRRCFAFFHPRMPDEPVIFVQVALVKDLAENIQVLLDESAPLVDADDADTAIFYSITNAQSGLAGVGFGEFLIKRVVSDIKEEFPHIKTFSTLSPIPGFCRWLAQLDEADQQITTSELKALEKVDGFTSLNEALSDKQWYKNTELASALEKPLLRLCAYYLSHEKRRDRALDPVANFHLNNGARLERINWLGDTSDKGMQESAGMMVNYLYDLNDIEDNHETYRENATATLSSSVKSLLKKEYSLTLNPKS